MRTRRKIELVRASLETESTLEKEMSLWQEKIRELWHQVSRGYVLGVFPLRAWIIAA